jgi:hypothetical protein
MFTSPIGLLEVLMLDEVLLDELLEDEVLVGVPGYRIETAYTPTTSTRSVTAMTAFVVFSMGFPM